jgi:hypothetical protein
MVGDKGANFRWFKFGVERWWNGLPSLFFSGAGFVAASGLSGLDVVCPLVISRSPTRVTRPFETVKYSNSFSSDPAGSREGERRGEVVIASGVSIEFFDCFGNVPFCCCRLAGGVGFSSGVWGS